MRLLSSALLLFLGCLLLFPSSSSASSVCEYAECKETAAEILSNLNEKVDPCHDFYSYSCGGRGMNIMSLSKMRTVLNQRINSDLYADDNLRSHGSKVVREAKKLYDDCVNTGKSYCNSVAKDECYFAFIRVYIDKYFPVAEHRAATRLISSIRKTFFSDIVDKITWIDPETKKLVVQNLTELQFNIGYPEWLKDDMELDMACEDVKRQPWPMDPLLFNAQFGSSASGSRISKCFYPFHKKVNDERIFNLNRNSGCNTSWISV